VHRLDECEILFIHSNALLLTGSAAADGLLRGT